MPATYAALWSVVNQTRYRLDGWAPTSLLDVGAGSGTSLWVAASNWPSLAVGTLIDTNDHMIQLGRRLASTSSNPVVASARWQRGRLETVTDLPAADLVIASYVTNEMVRSDLEDTIERLWSATTGVMILVEPGTPVGFDLIRRARQRLITLGARIVAPCPHGLDCPMPHSDWCHFSVRLPRNRLHRSVKPGELGYEDEKFSYVVASRGIGQPGPARVIRRPTYRRKMIELKTCTPSGLQDITLTRRRDPDQYRLARSLNWGDEVPLE